MSLAARRVEADHVRQVDRVRHAVGHAEVRRRRGATSSGRCRSRRAVGVIASDAAISMLPRASSSSGVVHGALEVRRGSAAAPAASGRPGAALHSRRHVALDGVGHRVHAGGGGDGCGGSVRGGLGVEDRQPREQREVRDLELDLLLVVLDHGRHRHLASRCRRWWGCRPAAPASSGRPMPSSVARQPKKPS